MNLSPFPQRLVSEVQRELEEALVVLESTEPELPDIAEIEPGAFLHLVHRAWTDAQHRDGRRGHLSDQDLASMIQARTQRPFTRNQYLTAFGEGKRSRDAGPLRYKTGIPRDVAWAYLRIAFDNWALNPPGHPNKYQPLLVQGRTVSDTAINNACDQMYPTRTGLREPERVVYCRESPGFGVRSFYRECGRHGRSVIVSTTQDAFVMTDIGVQLPDWEYVLNALFAPNHAAADQTSSGHSIHVWAFKEPWIADDERSYKSMTGLTNLQGLLKVELALHKARATAPVSDDGARRRARLWNLIQERCVIAIKLHPSNNAIRGSTLVEEALPRPPRIAEDFIFPTAVPQEWARRGVSAGPDELISVVTVDGHDLLTYNGFAPTAQYPDTRSLIQVPQPSVACSQAFLALYRASVAARHRSEQPEANLSDAHAEGWRFFSPTEFIELSLPISANP
jgi:hypothetical protein